MLLSDAIMMNGMSKPQGFGSASMSEENAPCALGGALQTIGRQKVSSVYCAENSFDNFISIKAVWPWTETIQTCPICNIGQRAVNVIWHLNDEHRWTRAQIAEWVASAEPAENINLIQQVPITEEKGEMVNG